MSQTPKNYGTGRSDRKEDDTLQIDEIADLLRRVDALPNLDARSENEILEYDDNGTVN